MGLCESDRLVVGDKRVGAYLTLFPEYCFVTENMSDGTIGKLIFCSNILVRNVLNISY